MVGHLGQVHTMEPTQLVLQETTVISKVSSSYSEGPGTREDEKLAKGEESDGNGGEDRGGWKSLRLGAKSSFEAGRRRILESVVGGFKSRGGKTHRASRSKPNETMVTAMR